MRLYRHSNAASTTLPSVMIEDGLVSICSHIPAMRMQIHNNSNRRFLAALYPWIEARPRVQCSNPWFDGWYQREPGAVGANCRELLVALKIYIKNLVIRKNVGCMRYSDLRRGGGGGGVEIYCSWDCTMPLDLMGLYTHRA